MRKQLLQFLIFGFVCTLSMAIFAACDEESAPSTENTLSGFSTETQTDIGELGGVYTVEEFNPIDAKGKFYDVEVSVMKDGDKVQVIGGGFEMNEMGDYVITYSVNFNGETLKKTTTLTVKDTLPPTVETDAVATLIYQNAVVDLSPITARDWNEVSSLTKTVALNGQPITLSQDTFTATEHGVYSVLVTAEDAAGNRAEHTLFINCMRAGELYNFESPVGAAEIYNATTMEHASQLPEGNATAGLKMTFARDFQGLYFRDLNSQMLAAKEKEGFNTLFFDVYYQGEDTNRIFITPFGAKFQQMRANEWTTIEVPLSELAAVKEKTSHIAFNVDAESPYPQSSYIVYLDNIRVENVVKKEKLYNGFEDDGATNLGWKHFTWYSNIEVLSAQTDIVHDGMKSLKIASTATSNYVHLKDGNNVQLDNAWIKARAGKSLYFWVYYKNEQNPSDALTLEIKDGADGATKAYSQTHVQGEWAQVCVSLDDMTDFSKITISISGDHLSSGAVYFDSFEIY